MSKNISDKHFTNETRPGAKSLFHTSSDTLDNQDDPHNSINRESKRNRVVSERIEDMSKSSESDDGF